MNALGNKPPIKDGRRDAAGDRMVVMRRLVALSLATHVGMASPRSAVAQSLEHGTGRPHPSASRVYMAAIEAVDWHQGTAVLSIPLAARGIVRLKTPLVRTAVGDAIAIRRTTRKSSSKDE